MHLPRGVTVYFSVNLTISHSASLSGIDCLCDIPVCCGLSVCLYVRACFESTLKWSRLAGSTEVHDLAGEFDEVDYY